MSEWADAHRVLSPESSAEPGRWRTSRAPFQKEVLDAFSDPEVKRVVVMASTQMLKTEVILNVLGYFIDVEPCSIMSVISTLDLARAFSKDRLSPMIRDSPTLAAKVKDVHNNDPDSTTLHKKFPGGHITISGANSPDSLASRPIRVVLCDEVDRYPLTAGTEGDPVSLVEKRTATFHNSIVGLFSSPGVRGRSRIEAEYKMSDRRRYLVPCPECDHYQVLKWANLQFEKGDDRLGIPETAAYACEGCGFLMEEHHKAEMLERGRWEAQGKFKGVAGFWINELYSPWTTWAEMVEAWNKILEHPEDINLLRVFINTRLAESFEERGEAPDWERLYGRREDYPKGVVPERGLLLTAGVDVQQDRLEYEVVAWGKGLESWSVEYGIIPGSYEDEKTWQKLDALIGRDWEHALGGRFRIRLTAIDSGYASSEVYRYGRRHGSDRVMVVKGMDAVNNVIGVPKAQDVDIGGKKVKDGVYLWGVGSSYVKKELYAWLRLERKDDEPLPGYMHFPDYDERYFQMLTAEELRRSKNRRGYWVYQFVKIRTHNEALDIRVYARAAAASLGIERFTEVAWDLLESQAKGETKDRKAMAPSKKRGVINPGVRL